EAAREILDRRASGEAEREQQRLEDDAPVQVERRYNEASGPRAGERMPANQTVPIEQASDDVAQVRRNEAAALRDLENKSVRDAIDRLRAGDQQPVETQQTPQAQHPVEQQTPQAPSGVDPEVWQALQSNPKLLAAVSEVSNQAVNSVRYAEQERE